MSTFRGMGGGGARYRTHGALNLKNPFEEEKPHKHQSGGMFWGFLIMGGITLGVLIYLLFFADWMKTEHITVSGNLLLTEGDISQSARKQIEKHRGLLSPYHRWALSKATVGEALQKSLPLTEVTLDRSWSGDLDIHVTERAPSALVYFDDQVATLLDDQGGVLIAKLPFVAQGSDGTTTSTVGTVVAGSEPSSVAECIFCDTKSGIVPIYYTDHSPKNVSIGTHPIPLDTLNTLQNALRGLSITGFYPQSGMFTPSSPEKFVVTLDEGFQVYIDTTRPLEPQLSQFKTFMKKKFTKPPYPLTYVDVRFINRVFYK